MKTKSATQFATEFISALRCSLEMGNIDAKSIARLVSERDKSIRNEALRDAAEQYTITMRKWFPTNIGQVELDCTQAILSIISTKETK